MTTPTATMRDSFIDRLYERMREREDLFFLTADFGAPKLDGFRVEFADRFINVGIAEQNLINVAAGLALEGFTAYAYGIAPFLTMRAYEQIRNNLALMAQLREVNVNMIGVGAGLSYDVSGPTHHCLEDIGIMRILPNVSVLSPSDPELAARLVDYTLRDKKPKYLRFDGKPLPPIYRADEEIRLDDGLHEFVRGSDVCIVSTGYMTHKALRVRELLSRDRIDAGVIDVFILKPCDESALSRALSRYDCVATLEEGFVRRGGLDGLVSGILNGRGTPARFAALGFGGEYVFEIGDREYLYALNGLDDTAVADTLRRLLPGTS